MKSFVDFYNESLAEDKARLIDYIKNADENQVKKIDNAISGGLNKKIKEWLQHKHLAPDQIRCILGLLADYDYSDIFENIINENGIIDSKEITEAESGNLLDILHKYTKKYDLNIDFIKELMKTQPGQRGVTVGPGEIALMCLVKDCTQNAKIKSEDPENKEEANEIGSDLKIGGVAVEVKGTQARLLGQGINVDYLGVIKRSKEKYKIDIINTIKEDGIPALNKLIKNTDKFTEYVEYCFKDYITIPNVNTDKIFKEYVNFIKSKNVNTFLEFALSLALYSLQIYHIKEKFQQIMLINTKSEKYPFIIIKDFNDITSLFNKYKKLLKVNTFIDPKGQRREVPKISYVG